MHEVPTGGIVAHSGLCSESESIRILGGGALWGCREGVQIRIC